MIPLIHFLTEAGIRAKIQIEHKFDKRTEKQRPTRKWVAGRKVLEWDKTQTTANTTQYVTVVTQAS